MRLNWRRLLCWWSHKWEILDGERHCIACGYTPKDDGVRFCPKCGSERLMGNIMASAGYQYVSCRECDHKFQETSESAVTVTHEYGCYELEKPMVDQDGSPIREEEREEEER